MIWFAIPLAIGALGIGTTSATAGYIAGGGVGGATKLIKWAIAAIASYFAWVYIFDKKKFWKSKKGGKK